MLKSILSFSIMTLVKMIDSIVTLINKNRNRSDKTAGLFKIVVKVVGIIKQYVVFHYSGQLIFCT